MREFLNRLIAAREQRARELRSAIEGAQTADEVRSLGATLQTVLDELREARDQLAALDEEDGGEDQRETGNDEERNGNPMHEFREIGRNGQRSGATGDRTDTVEYRTAFMNYVCRNVPMPAELRADAVTATGDASVMIPTTMLHEIIRKMDTYGDIYALVRKLNVQGGVEIPVLSVKPTATWITADTGTSESAAQKLQANEKISFSYFGLECKIAQTLLVNVTTLDMFQALFVELATEAIVRAAEAAIVKGTGKGQPTGITVDTRVPAENKITMTAEDFASWSGWKKKVFAKMKKAYRNGVFVMAQATFDGYIDGMEDSTGQPIGRVNYGIDGAENYRFGGKTVQTTEEDLFPAYETATTGDVVAAFVNWKDYAINSNMSLQIIKWVDHDTNTLKNKAIMIMDGKLVDPNGVLLIVKG